VIKALGMMQSQITSAFLIRPDVFASSYVIVFNTENNETILSIFVFFSHSSTNVFCFFFFF